MRAHRCYKPHQRDINDSRHEEADEPSIVIEKMQWLDGESNQRNHDAEHKRYNCARVDALGVVIDALAMIKRVHIELCFTNKKVIGNHDSSDRSEQSGVADEPTEDVRIRRGQQLPRTHRQTEKASNQSAGAKADEPRIEIGEIIRRRDNIGADV